MATVTAIKERTQSKTAMRRVMDYVIQNKKTLSERGFRLISGQNCCAETAVSEFMATKRRFGKESGTYFYQYVQSFKPGERAAQEEIHRMGVELAEYFKGHEVLIASHFDSKHWHNHLVVNSVSIETGLKLQFNKRDLIELRAASDRVCAAHGLDVLEPYTKHDGRSMNTREYRAALRGDSWKFKLINAIDRSMAASRTKAGFIANMRKLGYQVDWQERYKHVTYTTPEGHKCRDNKLHEDKYLKERMEAHFGHGEAETAEPGGTVAGRISSQAQPLRHTAGHAGTPDGTAVGHSAGAARGTPLGRQAAGVEPYKGAAEPGSGRYIRRDYRGYGENSESVAGKRGERNGGLGEELKDGNGGFDEEFEGAAVSKQRSGHGGFQNSSQADGTPKMGGNRSGGFDGIVSPVQSLESLLNNDYQREERPRTPPKRRAKRKVRETDEYDEWEMEM